MRIRYLLSLLILFSFLSLSTSKYENSNLKKFLSKIGLPDVPKSHLLFDDDLLSSNKTDNDTKPDDDDKSDDVKPNPQPDDDGSKEKDKTIINIKCLWVDKYDVFTLQKLINDKDDYQIPLPSENGKIFFNLCKNTKTKNDSTVVWQKNDANGTLIRVAGSIDGNGKNENDNNKWEHIEGEDFSDTKGIKLRLAKGDKCNNDFYHKTIFKIVCDPEIEDDKFFESINLTEFNSNGCDHVISSRSIYGCALNEWHLLRRIMNKYKILFGLGFILVGLFLCMFGNKFEKPTVVIVMGIIGCYLLSAIVLNFVPSLINTEKKLWYLLGITYLVGAFIGFFLRTKLTIFTVFLGGSMGYSLVEFVFEFLQGFIEWNPQYLYYATVGVCCLIGGLIGYYLLKVIMIIGTSLLGGYIAMRGVSTFFGNYREVTQFIDVIKSAEFDIEQIKNIKDGWTYAYLGLWLILTLFGVYYQCIGHKKKNANSKDTDYSKIEK